MRIDASARPEDAAADLAGGADTLWLEEGTSVPAGSRSLLVDRASDACSLDGEDAALRYEEWLSVLPPATLPPPPAVPSTPLTRALRPLGKIARLPQRISRDPMVWAVVLATILAAALLLWKR